MIDDRTQIQLYLDKSYKQEFHMVKGRQITKLEKMKNKSTTPEKLVLNKGLNFATTIKRIPYWHIIESVEDAALKITQPLKPNISKTERQALKSLQDDDSIIILPADKGNATVVMDRLEYSNKLADLIGNGGYSKVKKDPTLKTERKLSRILSKNKDLIPQTKYRLLIQYYSKLPHIYGLLKINKNSISLRPIVSIVFPSVFLFQC